MKLKNKIFSRNNSIAFFLFALFVLAYIISRSSLSDLLIEKELNYNSVNVSEAYLVWGINYLTLPDSIYIPSGSYIKDKLVYTRMYNEGSDFKIKISLPPGTTLNYWIWVNKDKEGKVVNIWESGGDERFNLYFSPSWLQRPGFFLFLAGAIPVLFIYLFRLKDKKTLTVDPDSSSYKFKYTKELDSIRAIAVFLVIIHHWLPKDNPLNIIDTGRLGVNIFFVLSGFLITRILLQETKKIDSSECTKGYSLKNFIMRRAIRIFPIYYLYILFIFLFNNETVLPVREYTLSYLAYTSNILFFNNQIFSGSMAHTWSLAVEEQFYIIWPLLVLFANRRFLPYLISLFIIVGITTNYIIIDHGWWVQILTPACFDAFGIGAVFSYILVFRFDNLKNFKKYIDISALIAFVFFILSFFNIELIPARTYQAVLALWLIYFCIFGKKNFFLEYIFGNRVLIFLGKISYGIYLYHLIIPGKWKAVIDYFSSLNIDFLYNQSIPDSWKVTWLFIQHLGLVILISWISWIIIESPLNELKNKFSYLKKENNIKKFA